MSRSRCDRSGASRSRCAAIGTPASARTGSRARFTRTHRVGVALLAACLLVEPAMAQTRPAPHARTDAEPTAEPPVSVPPSPGAASELEALRRDAPVVTYRFERALYEHALAAARAAAERRGEEPPDRVEGLVAPERPVLQVPAAGAPRLGSSGAGAEIVVIENFAQPATAQVDAELQKLRRKYGDDLALVHVDHVPARAGAPGLDAAVAARCAHEQGRFWDYRERLLAGPADHGMSTLTSHARGLDLDAPKFEECLLRPGVREAVRASASEVEKAGVVATPTLLADGTYVEGGEAQVLDALVARRLEDETAPRGDAAEASPTH